MIDMNELEYMLGWGDFPQPKINGSTAVESQQNTLSLSSDDIYHHEDKIAKVLNKYFGDKWVEYSIEENVINRISTEITISIVFKNNRKGNITLPAVLL